MTVSLDRLTPSTNDAGLCTPDVSSQEVSGSSEAADYTVSSAKRSNTMLLVKHPSPCYEKDPWTIKLRSCHYEPVYMPVLDFSFDRIDELANLLEVGPAHRWGGVIVTSARSAEALQEAIYRMSAQAMITKPDWSSIPFFAVGQATARALRGLKPSVGHDCFPPIKGLRVLGADEAGSGKSLGAFIVRHFGATLSESGSSTVNDHRTTRPLPLLYLTGAHQHPDLSNTLSSSEPPIPFVEWQVYTAHPIPNPRIQPSPPSLPSWVILFSPNSTSLAFPQLKSLLDNPQATALRFAAIGPSTRDSLKSILGRSPDAVASRPQPDALLEAIRIADAESQLKSND
ncbi:tetrapyrrole biosynthesis, uroporphyrinogen III synthase [Melampsora americana]|nr:tetrapyrrole biosynthesis, uroporphyrinogen III synthase [Melampsora americana]